MAGLAKSDALMVCGEFFEFLATRPDEESWQLIDGAPVLSPSANFPHQVVVANRIRCLGIQQIEKRPPWVIIPGIGVRVSDISVPIPDVMILPRRDDRAHYCDDMIVAFEVLSPSTRRLDLDWKRTAYAGLASAHHYVIVAPDAVDVLQYARAERWQARALTEPQDVVTLPDLGVQISLAEIYHDTQAWRAAHD